MALPYLSDNDLGWLDFLGKEGRDYCVTHGMMYKDAKDLLQHIPFTLFPSPFPRRLFQEAKDVQTDFNLLVHQVSQDYEFIKNALSSTVSADPFTSRLFRIYEKAVEQKKDQVISLVIFRSDYLIDTRGKPQDVCCTCSDNREKTSNVFIKQVEINTIALGGITFSCRVPDLHRYLLSLMGKENKVPPNPALDETADALIKAWELYGSPRAKPWMIKRFLSIDSMDKTLNAVVMFVVQPVEVNLYDQKLLEYHVIERNPGVRVTRKSLAEIFDDSKVDAKNALFVSGLEIAVAYFRAGYTPRDYPTENEWSARLTVELSRCVKCPTVAHQLMGTKKMQQVLAAPGVLERFLQDKESVTRVRRTFTGLYSLDPGPEGDRNMECCLRTPDMCVLKPQREGGGNNLYGEEIRQTLLGDPENRTQYILMDRILPVTSTNYMVRQEYTSIHADDVIAELGIIGILISRGNEVLVNKEGGYLVRTKTSQQKDGGVFAGRAAFDSPYLVDQD